MKLLEAITSNGSRMILPKKPYTVYVTSSKMVAYRVRADNKAEAYKTVNEGKYESAWILGETLSSDATEVL